MDRLTIAGLAVGLALILLSNIPVFWSCSRHYKLSTFRKAGYYGYSDEDGEAIKPSRGVWADKGIRMSLAAVSLIGFACASVTVILEATRRPFQAASPLLWCQFGSWVLCSLQSLVFFTEMSPPRRFNFALCAFWTSIGLVALAAFDKRYWSKQDIVMLALHITNTAIAGIRAICCLLVPRRPNVYHEGQIVDKEYTVSILRRLTFGYVTHFVRFAARNQGTMVLEYVPQLPFRFRSEQLHDALQSALQRDRTLFQALRKVHARDFTLQVILAFGWALMSFGPQICLYGVLRSLEDQSTGSPGPWIAGLGVTMFIGSSLSLWLWCITYSRLSIPIYGELLALLYAKSMRRKNVQQAKSDKSTGKKSSKDTLDEGQQETINLVTIDTKRISDYVSYNHLIPSSVTQLIVACLLLIFLIGWQSLLAGLAANVVVSPFNLYIAKEYRTFQVGLMQARDQRTAVVHEMVKNIRQIKFSSLEAFWRIRVLATRRQEMRLNLKSVFYETGFQAMWTLAPLLLSAVALTVYAVQHGYLAASVAFTAISIFNSLEVALAALPHLISTGLEAKISVDRIDKYVRGPDKPPSNLSTANSIIFQDANVTWPSAESMDAPDGLSGLNLKFPPKGLTVITGRTGCGKSLLLSSILGECDIISGTVQIPSGGREKWKYPPTGRDDWIIDSAIAYVPQNPWTENGTIKDNILYGVPLDQLRYQEVLFASGLERDLDILTDGDQTDIGANGINLSGGQRARVSFARALYSRAGILVMDDIFSALDADTGLHLFTHGLIGDLALNRTRILATHHVRLCLPETDYCIVLADGTAACAGSMAEVIQMDVFAQYLIGAPDQEDIKDKLPSRPTTSGGRPLNENSQDARKFSPEEGRAIGLVPLKIYRKFLAGNQFPWKWIVGILASLLYTIFFFGRSFWLSIWTSAEQARRSAYASYPPFAPDFVIQGHVQIQRVKAPRELYMYIGVYVGISLAASIMGTLRFFFIRIGSMSSSQAVFKDLLSAVLTATLRWVDTVPLGRVLNRFTTDIYTLDNLLGSDLCDFLDWMLKVLGVLIACISISPWVLLPAAVLLVASIIPSVIYLSAAREVKRLESVTRTPILEQFTSSLSGLTTIRAFDRTRTYIHTMFGRIDGYSKVSRNLYLLNWWLQLRINILGAIFSTVIAVLVVKLSVSASIAGFAISLLLQYSTAVSSSIRYYGNFEMDMNAAERVIEYGSIVAEPKGGLDPPAGWPTRGHINVENLVVSYSPELPPVLKGLTFTVESNERVGVVGRTGSGKSTLALALFRFMEAREGKVVIDGQDTSQLKLSALRKALAIVPQDPTLFTGTIRSNLDPFDAYSDTDLYDAMERVHIIRPDTSSANALTLSTLVSEGGTNFSQGQRQLLCLARTILQQPKIMILDEATSAVDMETDRHIQEAIRSEFGRNATSLLVIAHRLSTIADFSRILVMDEGEIVEAGTPRELMGIQGGVFQELVNQSGEKALLEKIILDLD